MNTQDITEQYRMSQWIKFIRECHSSGDKVWSWCRNNNISTNSYYYWLRKIGAASCESLPSFDMHLDQCSISTLEKEELLKDFPRETVVCTIDDSERFCTKCGTELTNIGKEFVRTEIEFIPGKIHQNHICGFTYSGTPTPIRLFDYKPSRSGDCTADFLKGFKGYLHTDGYKGYNKVPEITRCFCWTHLKKQHKPIHPRNKELAFLWKS